MADDLDPILLKATRALATATARAQAAKQSLAPEDLEAFVREETGGKYGLTDAQKILTAVNPGVTSRNLLNSAYQGVTMNFGDEILSKLPSWLGGGESKAEQLRLEQQQFHQAHPYTDIAAGIGGSILTGIAGAGKKAALTAAQAIGRGAATGATVSGLSAAGAADGKSAIDRAKIAAPAAAVGGTIGAFLPGIAAGVKYFRDPVTRGASRVAHAIDESGGIDAVRQTVRDFGAAGRGAEVMLGDVSDHTRAAADFAANNSDDALIPLAQKIKARQGDASERLLGDVRLHIPGGDADAAASREALGNSLDTWAAGPNGYGGLRDANAKFDITPFRAALNEPTVKSALNQARIAGDLDAVNPMGKLLSSLEEGGGNSRPVSFDDLHQLKRAIDGKASAAFQTGNGPLGNAYATIRDAIDGALEKGVPGYKAINATYAAGKGLQRAVTAGEKAWDAVDSRALARDITKLSPPELEQYRVGMASKLIAQLRSASTNRDEATRLLNMSPAMEDKVQTVFGDKATFDSFMKRVGVEAELGKIRNAVSGSATARRLQAAGFSPEEFGAHAVLSGPHGVAHAIVKGMAHAASGAVTRNTARETGRMLMTQGDANIQKFLDQLAVREPMVGRAGSIAAPAGAGRLASLLFPD